MSQQYVDIVRALPRPTWQQCFRFVWYVSRVHSWYKHLPTNRTVPITVFLQPNVGMQLVITSTGERAFVERRDDTPSRPGGGQTTRDYRARLGHWAYYAPYGTYTLVRGEGGIVTTLRGIEILSDEGSWLPVPEALRASGSAMVNAFVHEVRLVTPFFRSGAGGTMESQQALAERVQSWAVECAAELQAAGGSISQDLELAVRRWGDRALLHAAERGIWCWNDYQVDQWLDELCRAGASGVDVPGILAVLRSALSDRIHSAPEGRFSNQLCTSLVTVRLHQLWAIWSATQRFDRSVFGDID